MKDPELKPYDDRESIKHKANQYIDRILLNMRFLEHKGITLRPTVFISLDIMDIIAKGSDMIFRHKPSELLYICGCEVKQVPGTNVLHIGYSLL